MLRRDDLVAHHGRERPEPQLVEKHEEAQREEADPLPRGLTEPEQPDVAGMASVVQPKRRHADGHAKRRHQEHRPPPDPVGAETHADHTDRAHQRHDHRRGVPVGREDCRQDFTSEVEDGKDPG